MKIFDISPLIHEKMLIYPGDGKVKFKNLKKAKNGGWNLSEFCMGGHTGSHVDTPLHISVDGKGGDAIDLTLCYGKCDVLDLSNVKIGNQITKSDLEYQSIKLGRIVLLKTQNSNLDRIKFNKQFITLSEDGANYLARFKIKAVGIDYLSLGNHKVHETLLMKGILVYENLDLSNVQPGNYIFSGFPLKMPIEGIPTRCILIKE